MAGDKPREAMGAQAGRITFPSAEVPELLPKSYQHHKTTADPTDIATSEKVTPVCSMITRW